jgi:hypothetical protein
MFAATQSFNLFGQISPVNPFQIAFVERPSLFFGPLTEIAPIKAISGKSDCYADITIPSSCIDWR